jgi:hypothetical protein
VPVVYIVGLVFVECGLLGVCLIVGVVLWILAHLVHGLLGLLLALLALLWSEQSGKRSDTVSFNKSVVLGLLRLQGRHEVDATSLWYSLLPPRLDGSTKAAWRGVLWLVSRLALVARGRKAAARHPGLRSGGPGSAKLCLAILPGMPWRRGGSC